MGCVVTFSSLAISSFYFLSEHDCMLYFLSGQRVRGDQLRECGHAELSLQEFTSRVLQAGSLQGAHVFINTRRIFVQIVVLPLVWFGFL